MENYLNESMVDVAYSVLKEKGRIMNFNELFSEVATCKGLTDEEKLSKMSKFYTNLSLDGRFVTLGNNEWDLRENQTYDKVHIDMNDVYSDIDEESDGNFDEEEADDLSLNEDKDDIFEEDDNKSEDIL